MVLNVLFLSITAGHCLAKHMIHEQNLVVNQPKQYQ